MSEEFDARYLSTGRPSVAVNLAFKRILHPVEDQGEEADQGMSANATSLLLGK
ncbi:MAG: hypothetical protein MN733_40705 [Nitrososphaera sp.]|nr:hypothetical protein [Nitrososphaera sp.]